MATDPITAFAEVFQNRRRIVISADKAISAWFPQRPLRLLDLTQGWPTRNGASASLHAAPKSTTQTCAHQIHTQLSSALQLDGLYVPSIMTLTPMAALFTHSQDVFPVAPTFSQLLTHRDSRVLASKATISLNSPVF